MNGGKPSGKPGGRPRSRRVLPGFGLTLGVTLGYLGVLVLIPLGALFLKASGMGWAEFLKAAGSPRAMASYRVTFGSALLAASVNAVMGTLMAWVLVRYRFPGRRVLDALVDFPFALPTAVGGLTLANLFASKGWLGRWLEPMGLKVAYAPAGIVVALVFIGLPFVVRSLQPVLEDIDREVEEAAATLGAGRLRTFAQVIFPVLLPSILTGFSLALARAIASASLLKGVTGATGPKVSSLKMSASAGTSASTVGWKNVPPSA